MPNGRGTLRVANRRVETLILLTCYAALAFCALETDAAPVTSNNDDTFKSDNRMSSPWCGVTDSVPSTHSRAKRYILQACKWHRKDLTYNVTRIPEKYNRTLVEEDIAKAFATWSNYTDLTFTPTSGKADIILKFGKIDGIGKTLASASLTCSGVGKVLFDEEELHWGMNGEGNSAFYKTAVHEVGHAIGVYHSKVKPSVMNGGFKPYKSGLFNDDIAAVQALYGKKTDVKFPKAPNVRPYEKTRID